MRACVCVYDVCLLCVYERIPVYVGTHTHGTHAEVTGVRCCPSLSASSLKQTVSHSAWFPCARLAGPCDAFYHFWLFCVDLEHPSSSGQTCAALPVRHSLYHAEPRSRIPHYLLNVIQSGGELRPNQFLEK